MNKKKKDKLIDSIILVITLIMVFTFIVFLIIN